MTKNGAVTNELVSVCSMATHRGYARCRTSSDITLWQKRTGDGYTGDHRISFVPHPFASGIFVCALGNETNHNDITKNIFLWIYLALLKHLTTLYHCYKLFSLIFGFIYTSSFYFVPKKYLSSIYKNMHIERAWTSVVNSSLHDRLHSAALQ